MSSETQVEYLRRREAQERVAALASISVGQREAHMTMAEYYADRIWSLDEETPMAVMPIVQKSIVGTGRAA